MYFINYNNILISLGKNIFNHIIENTNPDDEFRLSIIDPFTFEELMEKTGDFQEVEKALKKSIDEQELCHSNNDVAILIVSLQVYLIYYVEDLTDGNSFYEKIRDYYKDYDADLKKATNAKIQKIYFEEFQQEDLWERVKNIFAREKRVLIIPPRKGKDVAYKYVQFPREQQLISRNEIIKYADKFKSKFEPYQILSFDDFCDKLQPDFHNDFDRNYQFSTEDKKAICKIIFSFYKKWDGCSTDELRNQRFKQQCTRRVPNVSDLRITLKLKDDALYFFKNGEEISEDELESLFINKYRIPFIFDDDYEDWENTKKLLRRDDKLLVLINKLHRTYIEQYFKDNYECKELKMEYFYVYIFKNCDSGIAAFAELHFDKNEIYTIVGGINVRGYRPENNVLGRWYDFALPKIKINSPQAIRVFIDSKEIVVNKEQIDLSKLVLKKDNTELSLKIGGHSLECTNITPAYFYIEESKANTDFKIDHGWIISSNDLRPVKHEETPNIIGLKYEKQNKMINDNRLRPFLSQMEYLENRHFEQLLNKKIKIIQIRRKYGF